MSDGATYVEYVPASADSQENQVAMVIGVLPRCPVCGKRLLRIQMPDGATIDAEIPAMLEPALDGRTSAYAICHRSWCVPLQIGEVP